MEWELAILGLKNKGGVKIQGEFLVCGGLNFAGGWISKKEKPSSDIG